MLEIELTQGQIALVDDCDADLAEIKWYAQYSAKIKGFYAQRSPGILMHRVILGRVLGIELEKRDFVDHIHHNTLDNRRSELRLATPSQNNINAHMYSTNISGYKGVSFNKQADKWRAFTYYNGVQLYLGSFDTPEDAARAYNEKVVELFGEFAQLNIGV